MENRVKSKRITIRMTPEAKESLDAAAKAEVRSVTNFIESLVHQHCHRKKAKAKRETNETK